MKTVFFSSKNYDEDFFLAANASSAHALKFLPLRLDETTAPLALGYDSVCVFVNDRVNREVLDMLAAQGIRLIALRCAGYNNVDLPHARSLGITVVRVPAYSPHAVAEHAVALLLSLNRHLHKAYNRVREGNFELKGLLGFDLAGKTVTVIGTGKIGSIFARIMLGFGCRVLAVDIIENLELIEQGVTYVSLQDALPQSEVISLHCPLTADSRHLIQTETIAKMKPGVLLINTGRGALVDASAVIKGLKSGAIGGLAMDVYEEEEKLFFSDHSSEVISDDVFMRLTTFPNVIITGHQAFFTKEAMQQIAQTTLANLSEFEAAGRCGNEVPS
jgi:D-lactate dehydrogenase